MTNLNDKIMNDELVYASEFAKKHHVEIKLNGYFKEKHPDGGHDYEVHDVSISRNSKTFTVKFGAADLGCEDGEILNGDELIYSVLARVPKYDPVTFEDFLEQTGVPNIEKEILLAKRWYEFETGIYKEVLNLFSDVLEELREIE